MKKILIIIPARMGSKGIKNKNISLLGSKKLIEHTFEFAKKLNIPNEICLSTNDNRIKTLANKYDIKAHFNRPDNISTDKTPMSSVVVHAINFYKKKLNFTPKYFLLLEPTSPFRDLKEVEKNFFRFVQSNLSTFVTVNDVIHHPIEYIYSKNKKINFVMKKTAQHQRRQDFPEVFFINGSVYAAKVNYFIKNKSFINKTSYIYNQPYESSIDIDDNNDLLYANWFLKNRNLYE